MQYKSRLFVIDDQLVGKMEEDLADPTLLTFYWEHTGEVSSYWITESDFRRNYPSLSIPRDFALYDHMLLITYDEEKQILNFDVVDPDTSPEAQIFRTLNELVQRDDTAFRVIPHAQQYVSVTRSQQ
jgi:hypothetical protein